MQDCFVIFRFYFLFIVAEDSQALQYCKSRHPHCIHLKTFVTGKFDMRASGTQVPPTFTSFSLNVNLTVVGWLQNADVMWLRNPLTEISSYLSISCELYPIDDKSFGVGGEGGFFYTVAELMTYEFLGFGNVERDLNPHPEYQSVCNLIPNKEYIDHFSLLQVQYFSEVKFGSLCKPCDLSQIFVVQATCCEKIESKIHHLKLVLDDWRNFTELSAKNASSKWSPSSWRAPQKCTG
ncbi:hypothetical protein QUC31_018000 [Theobroma cacao]